MPLSPSETLAAWANTESAPIVHRLAKARFPGNVATLALADIVEADFVGYAPITLDDFAPVLDPEDGVGEVMAAEHDFTAGALLTVPQVIYGSYITRHPVGQAVELVKVTAYEPPITFMVPGQTHGENVRLIATGL